MVLVGCSGTTGLFSLYDVELDTPTDIDNENTLSIAVFPNGQVLRGRVGADIQSFTWDQVEKKYVVGDAIEGTSDAKQITVNSNGNYFGAVVQLKSVSTVLAWKMSTQLTVNNLKNSK